MAGHRVSGKADYMMDDRHETSQSGQILTRQHFLLLVYNSSYPAVTLKHSINSNFEVDVLESEATAGKRKAD